MHSPVELFPTGHRLLYPQGDFFSYSGHQPRHEGLGVGGHKEPLMFLCPGGKPG